MKTIGSLKCLALALATASLVLSPTPGNAFLKKLFGGGNVERAPSQQEMAAHEAAAAVLVGQGAAAESAGNSKKASKYFKKAVANYPLTNSAATAQFRIAALLESDGKISSAFDAYQEFINRYKQSSKFAEALGNQYRIADAAKNGAKVRVFGIKRGFDTSRIVQMFEFVIANAPRGPLAAKSQFAIGEAYMADEQVAEGAAAFQKVVDEFPSSAEASRAQLAIADANVGEIEEGTYDAGAIQDAREALDDYKLLTNADQLDDSLFEKVDFVDEASADQNYKIARFYEKQGKYKAAAIYYAEVIRQGASQHDTDAKQRLAAIAAADPDAVKVEAGGADIRTDDLVAQASSDVKNNPGYLGPPAPVRQRPQMRATQDIPDFPFEEPLLPEPGAPEPGLDLDRPIDSEELLLPPPPTGDSDTEEPMDEEEAEEEEEPIELPPPPPPPPSDDDDS